MNCSEINIMINRYSDGELTKGEEGALFMHLAACSECRDEFKILGRIQNEFLLEQQEVPESVEKRIFDSVKNSHKSFAPGFFAREIPAYYFYAVTVLIVISSFIVYREIREMKYSIDEKVEHINFQQQQINSLIEGMPAVKVRAVVSNPDLIDNNKSYGERL